MARDTVSRLQFRKPSTAMKDRTLILSSWWGQPSALLVSNLASPCSLPKTGHAAAGWCLSRRKNQEHKVKEKKMVISWFQPSTQT